MFTSFIELSAKPPYVLHGQLLQTLLPIGYRYIHSVKEAKVFCEHIEDFVGLNFELLHLFLLVFTTQNVSFLVVCTSFDFTDI